MVALVVGTVPEKLPSTRKNKKGWLFRLLSGLKDVFLSSAKIPSAYKYTLLLFKMKRFFQTRK